MTGNGGIKSETLNNVKFDQLSSQSHQTLLKYCRNNPNFLRDPASFPQTLKLIGSDLATPAGHDATTPKSPEEVLSQLESWKQRVSQSEPAALQRPSDRELKRLLDALESPLTFTQITLVLQHLEIVGSGSETLWPTIAVEMRGLKFPPRPEVYWRWGFDEWGQQARKAAREDPDGLSALQQRYVDFLQERGELELGEDDGAGDGVVDALELVMNHCRTCLVLLKVGSPKVYLFEALGVGTTLADKINVCFGSGVSVEERLPKYVCGRCVEQVDAAYGLKMQIDRTDEELRSLVAEYGKSEKTEVIESLEEEGQIDSTEVDQEIVEEQHLEEDEEGAVQDLEEVTIEMEEVTTTKTDPDMSGHLESVEIVVEDGEENEEDEEMRQEYLVVQNEETLYEFNESQDKFTIRLLEEDTTVEQQQQSEIIIINENKKSAKPEASTEVGVESATEDTDTGKSFFTCKRCRVVLRTYALWQAHQARHDQERHLACSLCTKKFRSATTLRNHQRTHTNERPYVCDICDKRFGQNSNLLYHKKVHENIRDFACEECSYRARNQNDLNLHSRRHTGLRPYVCKECQLPFSTSSNLSKHVKRRHKGERKYKCDHCDKTFTTKETAQKHLVTHSGSKPFHCPECNMAYSWYNGMQKHLKAVHPGAPIPTEKSMMVLVQEELQREAAKAVNECRQQETAENKD